MNIEFLKILTQNEPNIIILAKSVTLWNTSYKSKNLHNFLILEKNGKEKAENGSQTSKHDITKSRLLKLVLLGMFILAKK